MMSNEAKQLFEEHAELIRRAVEFEARKSRFSIEDAEDFGQWVSLKLIDDDYARIRAFRGECGVKTFLNVVIRSFGRDFRIHLWGPSRDSRNARRLGLTAMLLERLLHRDGLSVAEAIKIMRENHGVSLSEDELRNMAVQLKPPKPRAVSEDVLWNFAANDDAEVVRHDRENQQLKRKVRRILRLALDEVEPEDALLLKLWLKEGCTLSSIARDWRQDSGPLYRRRARALKRKLRPIFEREAMTWEAVRPILGWDPPGEARDARDRELWDEDGDKDESE